MKKRYRFEGDILDTELVNTLLARLPRIINLQQKVTLTGASQGPELCSTNVVGAQRLLEMQKKNNLDFLQVSTDEVYGTARRSRPIHKISPLEPNKPLLFK